MSGFFPASPAPSGAPALPRQQRLAIRAASFGILAVLLALAACAAWGAAQTYRADVAVQRATEASQAIEAVRKGLAAEHAVRRSAGPSPADAARARHQKTAETVAAALAQAHMFTDGTDRRLVEDMQARHAQYLAAAGAPWGEAGSPLVADTSPDTVLDPLEAQADVASDRFRTGALGLQQLLIAIQWRVLVGGPIVFALGLLLVGLIWRVQRSEQRRGTARLVRNAYEAGRGERSFVGVVHHAPELVLICAAPGNITYSNAAATTLWSYPDTQLDGQSIVSLAHLDDRAALRAWWEQLRPAPRGAGAGAAAHMPSGQRSLDLRVRDGAGQWRPARLVGTNLLDEPSVLGIVLTVHDSGQTRLLEQERADQALLDPLTRLPNAMLLRDRLQQAMARAGRRQGSGSGGGGGGGAGGGSGSGGEGGLMGGVGVLAIGLDGLAGADTQFGPGSADAMTLEAAARLRASIRPQDTVARLDRATFVVLRDPVENDADAIVAAEAIAVQFTRPLLAGMGALATPVRIGVALSGKNAAPPEALIRDAGLAMRQVEPGNIVRHAVFQTAGGSALLDQVELESDLRQAVRQLRDGAPHEFRVHFQPIIALGSGTIGGFEALIRWLHPANGLVQPKDFIPMAEENGLIVPLGQWVLEEACRQVVAWQQTFCLTPPLTLSVNLSALQFEQAGLVADVAHALSAVGLAPGCLRLEITEGTIMRDPEAAVRTLWSLKELGVQLAIDDFGSGYAALPYLKQLPLGMLKVDDSFVSGIGRDQEDTATVRAVISLAKSLAWGVTAEGIETELQARLLRGWGCEFAQGFHFSRPLDSHEAGELLEASRTALRTIRKPAEAEPV